MIDGSAAVSQLVSAGVRLFVGVPDSLMKGFCDALVGDIGDWENVVASNEGSAVAIAAGHYLSTGCPAVVYMQNSGLGNAVNPLSSLASNQVYGIPMLLMIGWRGQPGVPDEPQHRHQGSITKQQLELLNIPITVVAPDDDATSILTDAVSRARAASGPVAVLVERGVFAPGVERAFPSGFIRMEVIRSVVRALPSDTVFVATTGYTGRELALVREERHESWRSDFLMVGSMGHAAGLALGLAKGSPDRVVCCFDGDGAVAMHLGSLASVALEAPSNLLHVVLNNRVHESVGGQPSALRCVDLPALAASLGYMTVMSVGSESELADALQLIPEELYGPVLLEARIGCGTVQDLPRPADFEQRAHDLTSWLTDG